MHALTELLDRHKSRGLVETTSIGAKWTMAKEHKKTKRSDREVAERRKAQAEVPGLDSDPGRRAADENSSLTASERRIRSVLDTTVDAIITIDKEGRIETFNAAAETMFGYTAAEVSGRNVSMLMGAPYRQEHDSYLKRYIETREPRLIGRVRELRARRKNGTEFPIQLSVSEIAELGLFTGVVRDVTELRTLQEEIVRIATAEQQRIGRELHDGTQQALTGLGLLAQNLLDGLTRPEFAAQRELAKKLASGIAETHLQVRRLAKGLVPVPIDSDGLRAGLANLASRTERDHGIRCRFISPSPVHVAGDGTALHLYRIAQEAVTNALKHSGADEISIRLDSRDASLILAITDNGIGIDLDSAPIDGLGLRIMEHRCGLVGGTFAVRRRKSGGTTVECRIPSTSRG